MNTVFARGRGLAIAGLACLGITLATTQTASAVSMVEIQISGLDLVYDGTAIFDAAFANTTRAGNPAQSDTLTTMSFFVDGSQVGSVLLTNIFADIYIAGVNNIPAAGGVVTSSGNGDAFGVDLLTINGVPGFGLALNIDDFKVIYEANQVSIATTGLATSLFTQSLPFGVAFDPNQPISIVFSSSSITNLTVDDGIVTGFHASGTGNIAQTIPEPGTLALGAMALAAVGACVIRRRSRKN